jgi:hypothetical protein
VPTTVIGDLRATVTPTQNLTDGQTVTVAWSGYAPNVSVNVLQCSSSPPTEATQCDLHGADILQPDPTGAGHVTLQVTTGAVGSGICDATHPGCVIVVNEGGSLAPAASAIVPISFG